MRASYKMPYSRVKAMEKDRPFDIRPLKNQRNPFGHLS